MARKSLRLFLLLAVVALFAATAAAQPSPETAELADVDVSSSRVYNEAKGETEPAVYIIQLEGEPLATYTGGIPGLAATSPLATGARKLDSKSPASLAYEQFLADNQDRLVADMTSLLGRNVEVLFHYRHAYNGLAVFLSPEEAARVAKLDGVILLYRESEEELLTDAGPAFIGAPEIWGGSYTDRQYAATLDGSQEVPPNASTATGTGTFSYNLLTKQLTWNIAHNVAAPTAAHIHSGAAGTNGPIQVPLDHTVNPMVGAATLTEAQQGMLVNQQLYVNIHTAAFPGGEIRGQIIPTGTMGEGIIIGVIDSGINSGHPSFAAVGGDGYVHTNPYGSGNYVGYCVANPSFCNDKLIGAWALHPSATDPGDADGHGTHTASTAAGNFLQSPILYAPTITYTFAAVSGVAPHANIIAYRVCLPSCPTSATTAAVNQAVIDGVDVTNYSISGGTNPYVETTAVAFRNAVAAGILPANSAGNSGPGAATVGHQGPWIMTVAASTHNRAILNSVVGLSSSSGPLPDILGQSPTSGFGPAPLVYAGAAPYNNPLCNPFPPNTFSGEIVVCDRGVIGRVAKGQNVLNAGGGGMILANDAPSAASLNDDPHVLPATHISYADGVVLKAWLGSGTGHTGSITGGVVDYDAMYGDNMASFSSRGPAGSAVPGLANLIKPDVTAPGLNILAAYRAGFTVPPEFNIISGTSMSSPHGAGAAALLRAMHPTWTPAEVKSALMMTAVTTVNKQDNTTPGDPFDFGGGRIDLTAAGYAGFVLDVTDAEYLAANPATGGDPKLLNLPSMANPNCVVTCSWTRTLRSVLDTDQEYNASVVALAGVSGTVTPANFTIPAGGTQVITVTLTIGSAPAGAWAFAQVVIEPEASEDFAGAFDIANWTLTNTPGGVNGSFNTNPGPPVELFVVGGNSGTGGDTDFSITIPEDGTISFDWGYQTTDIACWDSGGVVLNGIYTVLACNNAAVPFFDSTYSLAVAAGDTFGFRVNTVDGDFGAGTLGVTNFRFQAGSAPSAHMPIAVIPSLSNVPGLVTIAAITNAATYTLEDVLAIEITDLTSAVSGLTLGTQVTQALFQDPTNGNPYNNDGGTFFITVTVPVGAPRLVAEIIASEAPDADLFVGTGSTPSSATQVCASTSPTSDEYCNINNPAAGTWWVLVQNWQGSGSQPDDITLSAAVVPSADAGNMTITGPASQPAGTPFGLDINWNEPTMASGDRWYGFFTLGTDAGNPDNLGRVGVNLVRLPDPAYLRVAHLAPFAMDPGTAVTVTLNGAPALTNFAYGDSTSYIPLPEGAYDVEIFPGSSPTPAITGTVTLMSGSYYSAMATGDGTNQPLALEAIADDNTPPAAGNFKLRLGHLAPFASGAALADIRLQDGTPVLTNVAYGDILPIYLELPAGEYDMNITTPGGGTVLIDLAPVTANDGDIITAFATGEGSNQDLGVFAWLVDFPGIFLPLQEYANLRVAHLAPFAMDPGTAVTVTLNGAPALTNFAYGDSTTYITLPVGTYDVAIFPGSSATPAITATVTLMTDTYYTAVATGDGVNQALELVALVDDNTAPAAGTFHLRLGHLAPFASGAALADIRLQDGTPVLTNVAYGDVTGFIPLPAGTYNLKITTPGGGTTLIDPEPVTFAAGQIVTAFATGEGSNQDLGAFAWPVDVVGFFLPLTPVQVGFTLYLPLIITP